MSNQTLLLGKNYESNKLTPINTQKNGILWTKLKHERNDSRLFVATGTSTQSSSFLTILGLLNPSGSGKKIGIYKLNLTAYTNDTTTANVKFELVGFTGNMIGGTPLTGINMKIGQTNATSTISSIGFATSNDILPELHILNSGLGLYTHEINYTYDFTNEFIELLAGRGVVLRMSNNTNNMNIVYTYSINFIETEQDDDI